MRRPALGKDGGGDDGRVEVQPFLKWAGGKWAIAERLRSLLPADARERVYREPFLGGGAMFFWLQPEKAFLTDSVKPLIETYEVVRSQVETLVHRLDKLKATHSTDQYYEIRDRFNGKAPKGTKIDRAAWFIYLNKTCFNGLFRTNKSGEFNVPEGSFTNPRISDPERLRLASAVLDRAKLQCAPFDHLLDEAREGELVYLDPPYDPTSKTSSFAAYSDGAFTREDQGRLAGVFRALDERGCLLALSNSDTPLVRELYAGFDLCPIIAPRAISAKASTRGEVSELLVRNLKKYPK